MFCMIMGGEKKKQCSTNLAWVKGEEDKTTK